MTTPHLEARALVARTAEAVAAASAIATEHGLRVTEPRVLHDAFSVVVHLAPSPVVARVPVVLPHGFGREALLARQRRELRVVSWLASRGVPVVPPSPLLPREPLERGGLSMTFWELVQVDVSATPDYVASAGVAAALHAELRDYPGELPFMQPVNDVVPRGLAFLTTSPELIAAADLERARREWALLEPVLTSPASFGAAFPSANIQPVHGDAPSYNAIQTTSGLRYADFEDVTLGPVEWDLALFGGAAAAAYDEAASLAGVPPLDARVQAVMDAARALQVVSCLALVPQLPVLGAGLAPMLEQWRAAPFAGGYRPAAAR